MGWRNRPRPSLVGLILVLAGAGVFLGTSPLLKRIGAQEPKAWDPELSVVLPPSLATAMAGGDPFLAANLQVIRGKVVANRLEGDTEKALFARLLANASRMNPAHEDGYYIAQSILPWNGYVQANQRIQKAAAEARSWDWLPLFFRAFNRYYFLREPGPASAILRDAAMRAPAANREKLLASAVRWRALGREPGEALRIVRAMVEGTPEGDLRRNLRARQTQLEGLLKLRDAAEAFRKEEGRGPRSLKELVGYGGLQALPEDPFKDGYTLNDAGKVVITPPKPLREEPGLPEGMQ
ncbi:MAG: hypothetical protein ACLFQ3_09145 [Thiohalorhabdus sp.]